VLLHGLAVPDSSHVDAQHDEDGKGVDLHGDVTA